MSLKRRFVHLFLAILLIQLVLVLSFYLNSNKNEPRRNQSTFVYSFDLNKHVLVFLHIQKTGGSDFDRSIVRHLQVRNQSTRAWQSACEKTNQTSSQTATSKNIKFKKFICKREMSSINQEINWYFSRQTFGWICNLHPDYTDLKRCVRKFYPNHRSADFLFFTVLRDPIKRYVSEWQHVRRGATWSRHGSKKCLIDKYFECFNGANNWANVSIDEFIACKNNLANNRQTRMLALYENKFSACDFLTLIQKDERTLLENAKNTLQSLFYFGLTEYQVFSQRLFEKLLGKNVYKFKKNFTQANNTNAERFVSTLSKETLNRIKELNRLDLELYEYAKSLFFNRLKEEKIDFT